MKIVVLKFGGTSVGSIKKIKKIAEIIKAHKNKNYKVIVVSSAMMGVTNDLVKKSLEIIYKLIKDNYCHIFQNVLFKKSTVKTNSNNEIKNKINAKSSYRYCISNK